MTTKPAWDANVLAVKPVVGSWDPFDNPDHSFVAFYGLKYPLFMASREYHFAMHRKTVRRKDRRFHIILARSIDPTGTGFRLPHLSSGHVVVDPYRQTIVMTPTSDGKGTEIEMVYHENPRGNIPQALINWAAKNGLPRFISSLESACAKYEAYLLSKGRAPIRPLSEPALLEDDEAEEGKDEEAIDGEMDRAESGATNV
ncbi:hypothetical protein DFJ74DRAFT_709472 [Hyaloraphidium curvatum]|nr:hypothetical protein DFJ74DRAFT_709472 [Hyaloraphidium curvatum]